MKVYLALLGLALAINYAMASTEGHGHYGNSLSYQSGYNAGSSHGHGWGQQQSHGQGWGQDYYAKPNYKFGYGVHDHHTHDNKYHQEQRDGDKTVGSYGLREADGSWRNVHYTADHTGFKANVVRTANQHGHGQGHGQGLGHQG